MTTIPYKNMTNRELVLHVDNKPEATPLEKELAQRISELTGEIGMLNHLVNPARKLYDRP